MRVIDLFISDATSRDVDLHTIGRGFKELISCDPDKGITSWLVVLDGVDLLLHKDGKVDIFTYKEVDEEKEELEE